MKMRVVQGAHGPCPTEKNARRFIGAEPVEIEVTNYYARRLMHAEIVEFKDAPKAAPADVDAKAQKGKSE